MIAQADPIALDLDIVRHAHMFDDALFVAGFEVRHNILANRIEWRVPCTYSNDHLTDAGEWQPWTDRSAATARRRASRATAWATDAKQDRAG